MLRQAMKLKFVMRCAAIGVLLLAGSAQAVDLRDWGRKFNLASERFVVLASFNNEAVLDKETQLVWQRAPATGQTWETAVFKCHGVVAGGRSGWRLPSISELTSLRGADGVLPAGHPFLDLNSASLWSSTVSPFVATSAFYTNLISGTFGTAQKTLLSRSLCVRGGGVAVQ